MVEVRAAAPADAGAIARVVVDSWRRAYAGLLPDELLAGLSVEDRRRMWRAVLDAAAPGVAVLVAEDRAGPLVVGFVAARSDPDDPRHGQLMALYVAPGAWRRGIGTMLHDAALDHLARRGVERATLWVLDGNERADAFYRARGWVPDGRRQVEEWLGGVLPEHAMSIALPDGRT
ncbi:GNAT family N-acetyltransferase [Pseudonocardia yuanmonensis]|uniref:GNAT family N-acetyltransferase n=1 Tax=Pseudonocardia yuanmonensis TaxID=1095914 RepID=A0ABP8XEQ4_9PSEU